jgi:GT2 family glycosyltransferase
MTPELSVLVVTCGRPEALRRVLADLAAQGLEPERFEVLVSDDGSKTPAAEAAAGFEASFPLRFVRGPRRGPATARNRALPLVQAPLLLFLNDDVWLEPDLLETHLEVQRTQDRPTAIVGTFNFTPEVLASPINRLAEEMGVFGTAQLPPGLPLGPFAFCTGNLSVPAAEVLAVGGFDEAFSEPAAEDLDLGYRLERERGLRIVHSQRARAWHHHPHDFTAWWRRWHLWGRMLRQLADKHRDPIFWPGGEGCLDREAARGARERLLAQEALALELARWLERVSRDPAAEGQAHVAALGRTFRLPDEAELLMRVGLGVSKYFVQRAFWQAEAGLEAPPSSGAVPPAAES